jgi:peptidoglycan/xylan/chitin deacetylase (PgdA/CDA1 family)
MTNPDDRSHRGDLALPLGLTAAAFVAHALPAAASAWVVRAPARARSSESWRRPFFGIERATASGRGVALTFDDGPHPEGTPRVLAELERYGAQATFFLVGEQVRRNPALAAEIAAAGHRVALHCDRHRNLLRLAPWQVHDDLRRALVTIEETTDRPVTLYRPPYGVLNSAAYAHARRSGWRTLLWSQWGRDWEARATVESITRLLTRGVGEGSVLLLHDADDYSSPGSWRRTAAALPRVLEALGERGLALVDP